MPANLDSPRSATPSLRTRAAQDAEAEDTSVLRIVFVDLAINRYNPILVPHEFMKRALLVR